MTRELAVRLYHSAKSAVMTQFPTLEYWKQERMIETELRHRHGENMTLGIMDEMDEYYEDLSEVTYPKGGLNSRI